MPPSGLKVYMEATVGPFINRVGDSFGRGTASLLTNIVQMLVSSWNDPSNDILRAYWALYQDLFGPGEVLGIRIVVRFMEARVCRHKAQCSLDVSESARHESCRPSSACGHARLIQCHCFET